MLALGREQVFRHAGKDLVDLLGVGLWRNVDLHIDVKRGTAAQAGL